MCAKNKTILNITKPPPIVLSHEPNYDKMKLQINKFNCSTSKLNNKQIKVNVSNDTEYREPIAQCKKYQRYWPHSDIL